MIKAIQLKTIILSVLIITLTVGATFWASKRSANARETIETSPKIGYTIVLDAGHGGVDPGSVGRVTKITESELNLIFVNKLEHLLLSSGINVIKTRKDANGLYGIYSKDYKIKDMNARKEIIKNSH